MTPAMPLSKRQAEILLLVLTAIWGLSFPLSRMLLQNNSVTTILFVRFTIGTLVTLALRPKTLSGLTTKQYFSGVTLGLILFGSFYLQTLGLKYTTSARGAFLTVLYVIFVPFIAYPLLAEKPTKNVFPALLCALAGVVVLSFDAQTAADVVGVTTQQVNLGDFLVLGSSVLFAFHIVFVTKFANTLSSMAGGVLQMAVVAVGSAIACMILNEPFLPYAADWPLLLFFSIVGTSFVLVAQIVAQRAVSATSAGIIYSLEPIVATVLAWFLLSEPITTTIMGSAVFFFVAVLLTLLR